MAEIISQKRIENVNNVSGVEVMARNIVFDSHPRH